MAFVWQALPLVSSSTPKTVRRLVYQENIIFTGSSNPVFKKSTSVKRIYQVNITRKIVVANFSTQKEVRRRTGQIIPRI